MIRLRKKVLYYWLFVIFVGLCTFYFAANSNSYHSSGSALIMTEAEANITRMAVSLIIADIDSGKITSTDVAIEALSAELPSTISANVLDNLGTPDISVLSSRLLSLSNSIIVR